MNWFRFYHESLDDPKVQRLPGDVYKTWVNVLCIASRNNPRGCLPSMEDIGFALRVSTDDAQSMIDDLASRGLIDRTPEGLAPHNWSERQRRSDSSAPRVAKHREKQAVNNDDDGDGNVTGNVTNDDLKRDSNALEKKREEERREEHPPTPQGGDVRASLTSIDGGKGKPKRPQSKYPDDFETFWQAYPSGNGNKQRSYEQWKRIKPDADLLADILAGLDLWKQSDRWRRGFVKAAETWLKDAWWANDPPGMPTVNGVRSFDIRDYAPSEWPALAYGPANTPEERELSRQAAERLMG